MLKKFWQFSWLSVLLVILITLTALYLSVATESGARWTLKTLSAATPGLEISQADGSWLKGIRIKKIYYKSDAVVFTVNQFFVQWHWPDLWSGKLTVNKLVMGDVTVILTADEKSGRAKTEPKQAFTEVVAAMKLPFELLLNDFELGRVDVSLAGSGWLLSEVTGVLHYQRQQWEVTDLNAILSTVIDDNDVLSLALTHGQTTLMTIPPYEVQGQAVLGVDFQQPILSNQASMNIQANWHGPLSAWTVNILDQADFIRGEDRLNGIYKLYGEFDFSRIDPMMALALSTDGSTHWQSKDVSLQLSDVLFQLKGTATKYDLSGHWQAVLKDSVLNNNAPINGALNAEGGRQGLVVSRLELNQQTQGLAYEGQLNWFPNLSLDGQLLLESLDFSPLLQQKLPEYPKKAHAELAGRVKLKAGIENGAWLQLSSDNIKGKWLNHSLLLTGGVQWQPEAFSFDRLKLAVGSNQITVTGKANQQWQLSSEINFAALKELWPNLNGQLYAKANVSGVKAQPAIEFSGSSPLLAYQDWMAKTVQLKGEFHPRLPGPIFTELLMNEVVGPDFHTENIKLTLLGSEKDHRLHFNAGGMPGIAARWQGMWSREKKQWQGAWQEFTYIQSDNQLLSLSGPATTTLGLAPLSLEQSPLCVKAGIQKLCLQGQLAQQRAAAVIDIAHIDLSWLNPWLKGSAMNGTVSAHHELSWQAKETLSMIGELYLANVQLLQMDHQMLVTPPSIKSLKLNYQLDNQQWQLTLAGQPDKGGAMSVNAEGGLPLTFPTRMDVKLNQFAMAPWQAFIPGLQQLDGNVSADIQIEKTFSNRLQVTGQSHWHNGLVRYGEGAVAQYQNIELQALFQGSNANMHVSFDGFNDLHWDSSPSWTLDWSSGLEFWQLSRGCLSSLSTNLICVQGQRSERQGIHVDIDVSGDSNNLLTGLLPEELNIQGDFLAKLGLDYEGRLRANLQLAANNNQLTLTQADMPDFVWPLNVFSLVGSLEDDLIKVSTRLQGEGLGDGAVDLSFPFPLSPTQGNSAQRAVRGEIDLNDFQLSVLKPFLPAINALDGTLSMRGTIDESQKGGMKQPVLNGEINLSNGLMRSEVLPVSAENLNFSVMVSNNQAELNGSMSSGQGRVTLTGTAVTSLPNWQAYISLKGQQVPVVWTPEIDLLIDPDVFLEISPASLHIGGEVFVKEGFVTLEKLPEGSVKASTDAVYIDQREVIQSDDDDVNFSMNVLVYLDELVKLRGPGVEGRLQGEIRLKQAAGPVQATGYLNVVEGRYFGIGPRLTVRKGRVDFRETLDNPYLFIEAIRVVEDVTAGLRIEGSVDNPQISFFSEPSMPDDKILVYLLTGKPPGNGPLDTQRLANQALLSLGVSGGESYAQSLAQKIGIRDLEVSATAGNDETNVNIGGYLSPRVYIEYGRNLFSPANSFTVRYRIRTGLFLEAVSGLESTLDILYTFEF